MLLESALALNVHPFMFRTPMKFCLSLVHSSLRMSVTALVAVVSAPEFQRKGSSALTTRSINIFVTLQRQVQQLGFARFSLNHSRRLDHTLVPALQDASEVFPAENGREVDGTSTRKIDLQVVLVSPQIPGNTGCIARSCAAAAVGLHLVQPLGFEIDSAKLKRAGLDYWPYVVVKVHKSWKDFSLYFHQQEGEKRLVGFSKKGNLPHTLVKYRPGDWLLFGSETEGLPEAAVAECLDEKYGGGLVRIPIDETFVRCLNLSVAVGIGVYEALRQLGYADDMLKTPQRDVGPLAREDIFC